MRFGKTDGLVLLELLLVIAVAGFLTVTGIRTLSTVLERMSDETTLQLEEAIHRSFEEKVRHAWEQRASHMFQTDGWLRLEGRVGNGWTHLERLEFLTIDAEGTLSNWQLTPHGRVWWIELYPVDAREGSQRRYPWPYNGEILIDLKPGILLPGEVPSTISWRFPDARDRRLQEGFAIHAHW